MSKQKTFTADELTVILADHLKWLRDEPGGKRANLSAANLSDANLSAADLRAANLRAANLRAANLSAANLSDANLSDANLSDANLSDANLSAADLRAANLSAADLRAANLSAADLSDANLSDADLSDANLSDADLSAAKNVSAVMLARTVIVPPEGPVIGWKRCAGGVIVKLEIPADAKRSNAAGRKCRAEKALVLEVIGAIEGVSMTSSNQITYRAGETVIADKWDEDRWQECSHGIHFFITREEAEAYS